MKKVLCFLLLLMALPIFSYCQDKTTVTLFYSPHCGVCLKIKEELLPSLKEKYEGKVNWQMLNTVDSENLALLESISSYFQKEKALIPSVLVGKNFLVGLYEIEGKLDQAIATSLSEKGDSLDFLRASLSEVFNKLSIYTVMASGLIDGINPCAFAVIVFFISFLAVYGYKKRDLIIVGIFYCAAVFACYLLIGLGVFKFFYSFKNIYFFIRFFYHFIAVFCFLMGIAALYDYFKFKKTNQSEGAILQLPKFIKRRISITIGSQLRQKKQNSVWALAISSFTVGSLVSLLEAVCTGQVYVPIIVVILKNSTLKLKAATYLVLYNLMFIFPLVVIFILSLIGVSHLRFSNFLKKHLGTIKLLMAFLFFLLGTFILNLR